MLLQAFKGVDPRFDKQEVEQAPKTVGQAVTDYIEAKRHKLAASTIRDYPNQTVRKSPEVSI
jgi:hypothetical protein